MSEQNWSNGVYSYLFMSSNFADKWSKICGEECLCRFEFLRFEDISKLMFGNQIDKMLFGYNDSIHEKISNIAMVR